MSTTQTKDAPKARTNKLVAFYQSPIGKKFTTGVTGLALTLFVIIHMIGNLGYFSSDPGAYNKYADFLLGLGPLLWLVELILLAFFVFHAVLGISIWLGKKRARPTNYAKYRSSGNPSLQSVSSRSMILTGTVLLVFTVIHLISFKWGPGIEEGYIADVDGIALETLRSEALGEQEVAVVAGQPVMRDLRRLVNEKFQSPWYAFGYTAVMILLALHLRHGVWSALQSIGAMNPRLTPVAYTLGGLLGVLIAVGFFVLPLYIYFTA